MFHLKEEAFDWRIENSDVELISQLAFGCDFPGNNLFSQTTSKPKECLRLCRQTSQCSHYTWTRSTKVCSIKQGPIEKKDAKVPLVDMLTVCGIVVTRSGTRISNLPGNSSDKIFL